MPDLMSLLDGLTGGSGLAPVAGLPPTVGPVTADALSRENPNGPRVLAKLRRPDAGAAGGGGSMSAFGSSSRMPPASANKFGALLQGVNGGLDDIATGQRQDAAARRQALLDNLVMGEALRKQEETKQAGEIMSLMPGLMGGGRSTGGGAVGKMAMISSDPVASDLQPHQKAVLNAIAAGESGGKYNIRYTPGGGATFSDLSQHPNVREPGPAGPSTAAGRYQFTKSTWDRMGGGDFSPENQDRKAWQLATEDYASRTGRDLDADVQANGFTPAMARTLAPTWAALRGVGAQRAASNYADSLKRYGSTGGDDGSEADMPARNARPAGFTAMGDSDGTGEPGFAVPPAPASDAAPAATPSAGSNAATPQADAPDAPSAAPAASGDDRAALMGDMARLFSPEQMGPAQSFVQSAPAGDAEGEAPPPPPRTQDPSAPAQTATADVLPPPRPNDIGGANTLSPLPPARPADMQAAPQMPPGAGLARLPGPPLMVSNPLGGGDDRDAGAGAFARDPTNRVAALDPRADMPAPGAREASLSPPSTFVLPGPDPAQRVDGSGNPLPAASISAPLPPPRPAAANDGLTDDGAAASAAPVKVAQAGAFTPEQQDWIGRALRNPQTRQIAVDMLKREQERVSYGKPFRDEDGNLVQQDTKGQLHVVSRAEKDEGAKISGQATARRKEAEQIGLDPKSPEGRRYILTGQLPDGKDETIDAQVKAREQQAARLGMVPGTPAYQSYTLTGKIGRDQELSATDKKAIMEADEHVMISQNVIDSLNQAKTLSKQAYQGPYASERGKAMALIGNEAGIATKDLDNLIKTNALGQLKSIFGAAPTEGERAILLEIQGSSEQPERVRQKIYDRAIGLAQRRLELNQQRADELRGGTLYKKDVDRPAPGESRAAGAAAKPLVAATGGSDAELEKLDPGKLTLPEGYTIPQIAARARMVLSKRPDQRKALEDQLKSFGLPADKILGAQ